METWRKQLLSGLLVVAVLFGTVPMPSGAAQTDGLCAHHPQHTEQCGYAPALEPQPCGHIHDETCYRSVLSCLHTHGDCGYVAPVEGHSCDCQPDESGNLIHTEGCGYVEAVREVPCIHTCSEEAGCITQKLNCTHVHDESCGYLEAQEETPCGYVCEECEKEAGQNSGDISTGTPDSTPPTFIGLTLGADTVTAPGTLEVIVDAADDVSGVKNINVFFQGKNTGKRVNTNLMSTYWDSESWQDVSYPDGKYHGVLTINEYLASDDFLVESISLTDNAGNQVSFHRSSTTGPNPLPDSLESLSFAVVETNPDTTPPLLVGMTLSAGAVTAPGKLDVTVEATDDLSGTASCYVEFRGVNTLNTLSTNLGSTFWNTETAQYAPYPDGKLHGELTLDQYVVGDTYKVYCIRLIDKAGNENTLFEYEPEVPEAVRSLRLVVLNGKSDVVTSVASPDFLEEVQNAQDDAHISADYSGGATLPAEAFDAIAGTGKTLDLVSEGIAWRFRGSSITDASKPVALHVEIQKVEEDETDAGSNIQENLGEGTPGVVMKFPENGTLPGKATIRVKVDYAMRTYLGREDRLCVYYWNNQTGVLERIASGLTIIDDTYVEFEITHCSDYVLTVEKEAPPKAGRLTLPEKDFADQTLVWLNGIPLPVGQDDTGKSYVDLPEDVPPVLVTYSFNGASGDVHKQYPTGMKVYRIAEGTAEHVPELDNLLQYSGSSIRIVGKKGIRMITSVNQATRNKLTGKGVAGFTLLEYGTLLGQTSKLSESSLVLGGANVKSNYAYKKGVADPVFQFSNGMIQYTNVLVGFHDDQCAEDIAMRPYMKLQDENGKEFVVYGGIVIRSIGYIAYQNRNAFPAKSAAYEYVWSIIHNVYGNQYDSEYKT